MKFDFETIWNRFESIVKSEPSIRAGWNEIIGFHEKIKSKEYWSDLKNLEFEVEQTEIINWLENLVTEEPIDENIKAFWIGITKFYDSEKDIEFYVIYLVGCPTYNINDNEWACTPTYMPENRYFISDILNKIDKTIKEDEEDYFYLGLDITFSLFSVDNK